MFKVARVAVTQGETSLSDDEQIGAVDKVKQAMT
jgi:hypothetical protein